MTTRREVVLQNKILRKLEQIPHSWWVKFQAGPFTRKGVPDLDGVILGLSVKIEVKDEGEEPDPWQLREHEAIRKAGGIVLVVDSLDQVWGKLTNALQFYDSPDWDQVMQAVDHLFPRS